MVYSELRRPVPLVMGKVERLLSSLAAVSFGSIVRIARPLAGELNRRLVKIDNLGLTFRRERQGPAGDGLV
jgi:hypothetical protein